MSAAGRKRFAHGVVAGKLYPFHRGHRALIERALAECGRVTVLLGWHEAELIPGELRARWLRESLPQVDVVSVDCDAAGLADDDSEAWARYTLARLGGAPDAVFSGEGYGAVWAGWMAGISGTAVAHVHVDRSLGIVSTSGSAIRREPRARLHELDPHVARFFEPRRVVVLGAESTGKSTLSRELGEALATSPVPEYGARYTQALPSPQTYAWSEADFVAIAEGQLALEDAALAAALAPVVICDTDAYVTALFCESYTGRRSLEVERLAAGRRYDLYLICDPTTPFVQDETATRRLEQRAFLHERELAYARRAGRTVELAGSRRERLSQALDAIGQMLEDTSAPLWTWPGWERVS